MANLKTLTITGAANITDAGLHQLKGMTNLTNLKFVDTKVTDAGVAELKQSLPQCETKIGW